MKSGVFSKGVLLALVILSFHFLSMPLFSDGFIIPRPRPGERILPLTVKYHHVSVEIVNQVAKTSIDQVFINNHHRDIEGTYIFPLPEKAAISEFAMYIGDKRVEGEILDRDKARKIYEDIVRRLKDPALLEYVGRNMFRVRVYPIPAKGEKRIRLSYTEILEAESGLVQYVYPLNTEKFSYAPLEEVVISVDINSDLPLSTIYSSTHRVSVRKQGEGRARVSYEAKNIKPEKDFVLYYSLTSDEIGLSLMNWESAESNYFMLLASPTYVSKEERILNKNLVFVLDSSGSMSGEKIVQAKEAARFVIDHLDKRDRFSIIDFDDGVDIFAEKLVPANTENREKALSFIDGIEDSGGTNINDALIRALKLITPGERPNYVLFLTDGLPTVGITDVADILKNISSANSYKTRIFVFGVGYDVSTELLDRISLKNRGSSMYVDENSNLEISLSNYYEKISSPLLSDLEIKFTGIQVRDVYPQVLPDLFKGSQLALIGRYEGSDPVTVILSGKVGKVKKSFALENRKLVKNSGYNFLPRLWAARRIGFLLEEIRLNGEKKELVDEIKKLGLKYGIVTPYTSFLVTEKERLTLDVAAPEVAQALAAREVTGKGAFTMAKVSHKFKAEERAVLIESEKIRYKGQKTFYLKQGYWIDSAYIEGEAVVDIPFGSDQYFSLVVQNPGIAAYLSVAPKIIVTFEGIHYKIK